MRWLIPQESTQSYESLQFTPFKSKRKERNGGIKATQHIWLRERQDTAISYHVCLCLTVKLPIRIWNPNWKAERIYFRFLLSLPSSPHTLRNEIYSRSRNSKIPPSNSAFFLGCVTFSHISFLFPGEKYETLIVDSGYKVYMKLRIRNVAKEDFMEYKCVSKNSLGGSDGSITLYGE